MYYFKVSLDKGKLCWQHSQTTRATTRRQWFTTYAGKEYDIQNQSAHVMVLVFVTFMYAPLLPNMLPILLIGMLIHYFKERYLLAYYFKSPPAYGSLLFETSFKFLKYAPLLALITSYIALGNMQAFDNVPDEIVTTISRGRHSFHNIRPGDRLNQCHLFLVAFFGLLFFLIFERHFSDHAGHKGVTFVREDLGLGLY